MKTLDEKEIWQATLGELEVILSKANFTTWFKNTFIKEVLPEEVVIGVPHTFAKEWLEKKYNQQIITTLKKYYPQIKTISCDIIPTQVKPLPLIQASPLPKIENETNFTLNNKYRFANFIVGNSNRLAAATAQAVAEKPGMTYNPLFIYGGVGLGKTHLVQAIGNEIIQKHPKKKIIYTSCEKFTNDYINSISSKKTNEFKKIYRDADVLMVDDIQFMSGKEGTQEEFFHTFNALHQANRQIVITSDRIPKAIPQLTDRLASRFGMGMVADIQPPNLEMRQAILRSKCEEKGCQLDEDVLNYIAQNIESNIRELEGAINRVLSSSQMNQTEPSLASATEALKDIIGARNKNISIDKVLEVTTSFFEITVEDILSTRRNQELSRPRQIVMYLLRHEMNLSYPKIGQHLNKKDHTTVIYGVEKIEKEIARNDELHRQLQLIKEKLHAI